MSQQIIHKNRNGCALHGALKVLDAVDGFAPIVHSSAGCSIHSKLSENLLEGSNGLHYRGWLETSDTAIFEKQVIFGGTARLREQIKNTIKVVAAELYVVVTGCAPEIVGDDTPAMVKEAQEQNFPVITVGTPGFKGSVYKGYEWTLKALLEYFAQAYTPQAPDKTLVNILGVVPKQDLLWEGNLQAITQLLASVGLNANRLLGFGATPDEWRNVPRAALNLVVSPWGLSAARLLEKQYGTPFLYWGFLPVGEKDTSALLWELSEKLPVDSDLLEQTFRQEKKRLNYHLQRLSQWYIKHDFQKTIALVGETSNVLGLARFLQDSFGLIIKSVIITDHPDEELRPGIVAILNEYKTAETLFSSDGKEIDDQLRTASPELILGSSLEQAVADELSVPLIKISTPVRDKTFLQHTYAGYSGAVNLLQDYSEAVLKQEQSSKE